MALAWLPQYASRLCSLNVDNQIQKTGLPCMIFHIKRTLLSRIGVGTVHEAACRELCGWQTCGTCSLMHGNGVQAREADDPSTGSLQSTYLVCHFWWAVMAASFSVLIGKTQTFVSILWSTHSHLKCRLFQRGYCMSKLSEWGFLHSPEFHCSWPLRVLSLPEVSSTIILRGHWSTFWSWQQNVPELKQCCHKHASQLLLCCRQQGA